ncbi:MAG TPA: MFS transporter [Alphaproteobacteria bacterium]
MASATTTLSRHDAWIIGLVSVAHGLSHFFQLVLPPLFPFLHKEFDVSYATLGLMMMVFYTVSGVAQTGAGFLVDRYGARRILLVGLALFALVVALIGLSPTFWLLFPLAALAGIGNSVFHPADFAILNASITKGWLGRAYGAHSIAGNIGWALAPIATVGLATTFGWRSALIILGCVGLAAVAFMALRIELTVAHRPARTDRSLGTPTIGESLRLFMALPILTCFAYFTLLAMSLVGLQTFAIPAMIKLYDTSLDVAATSLTGFLLGGSVGILVGSVLADRTNRHHLVAVVGILVAAIAVGIIATGAIPAIAVLAVISLAGFAMGITLPSRDMLVRQSTPAGASGKVYGFVYSGLDLGSALTPFLFGWLLDHNLPRALYLVVVGTLALSIVTVLNMRRPASALQPAPGD